MFPGRPGEVTFPWAEPSGMDSSAYSVDYYLSKEFFSSFYQDNESGDVYILVPVFGFRIKIVFVFFQTLGDNLFQIVWQVRIQSSRGSRRPA